MVCADVLSDLILNSYEQLTKLFPDVEEYKMYHAQALYKAGMFAEAARATSAVDSPQHAQRVWRSSSAH